MVKRLNEWGKQSAKEETDLIFRNRNNKEFEWADEADEGADLILDNAVEPAPSPYPDIPSEMPGVAIDTDVVRALEPTDGPSEEARIEAAAANANFGPQDVPIVAPEPDEIDPPRNNIIYNVVVDLPGAVPAEVDEFDSYAADSSATPAAQQEQHPVNQQQHYR